MDKVIIDGVDVSECCYYESKNDTGEWCDLTCTRDNAPVFRCEKMPNCQYKQFQRTKAELKKYEDMAKKGLEEFKDVGGCWGCGLQLQLDRDIEDIKKLKAENERLKEENEKLNKMTGIFSARLCEKYSQALQEIREIAEKLKSPHCTDCTQVLNKKGKCTGECMKDYTKQIQDKINEVIGAEE